MQSIDSCCPSVMMRIRRVSSTPLNMATNAQNWSAFSRRAENGMMWQHPPRFTPEMTQVLLSRDAHADLTVLVREAEEDDDDVEGVP